MASSSFTNRRKDDQQRGEKHHRIDHQAENRIATLDLEQEYAKNMTVFGKILRNKDASFYIYQDDLCVAFHDINPIGECVTLMILMFVILD